MAVMLAAKARIEAMGAIRASRTKHARLDVRVLSRLACAVFARIQRPAGPQWCRVRGL